MKNKRLNKKTNKKKNKKRRTMHKTKKKNLGRGIFEILQARENTGRFKKTSISNRFLQGHAFHNQPRINKLSPKTKNEIGTSMASIRKRPKYNK